MPMRAFVTRTLPREGRGSWTPRLPGVKVKAPLQKLVTTFSSVAILLSICCMEEFMHRIEESLLSRPVFTTPVTVRRLTAGSAFWTATRCGSSSLAAPTAAVTAASNSTYSEVAKIGSLKRSCCGNSRRSSAASCG